ncbi:MAG: ABC transporter permease [Lachnospiraceae bacterium]|nr:ABC transporter permease [Lachnospiraceae bacterium]
MIKKANRRTFLASPYVVWAIGFTVIPLIVVCRYALLDKTGAFTLNNILAIVDPVHSKALIFSLEIALGCTLICILLAYPLCMALRRLKLGRSRFMLFILILPMWMNFILRLLAMQMILSNNGILNFILGLLGIAPLRIANTGLSIMIGVVYDYLPFMVLPIFDAISGINEDVVEAAQDLGAGRLTVFAKVILPLSMPGLLSGITMVFVPSMTSFVVADVLGGGKLQLVGNIIEQEFTRSMNWNLGAGLSVALMIFILISMAFTRHENAVEERETVW